MGQVQISFDIVSSPPPQPNRSPFAFSANLFSRIFIHKRVRFELENRNKKIINVHGIDLNASESSFIHIEKATFISEFFMRCYCSCSIDQFKNLQLLAANVKFYSNAIDLNHEMSYISFEYFV